MPSQRNAVIAAITDPTRNFLATFLISTILFNLISDGLSSLFWGSFGDWLQAQLGITSKAQLQGYLVFGLMAFVLLVIYSTNLAQSIKRFLVKLRIVETQIPAQAKVVELAHPLSGLVVIMSPKPHDSPAEAAITYHWNHGQIPHLKHCWVICTDTSVSYAKAMKQRLIEQGIDENRLNIYYGNYTLNDSANSGRTLMISDRDTEDPDNVLRLVNSIYADAETKGINSNDMIVDFTGGTKTLGVGAFLACAAPERRLEYLTQTDPPKLVEVQVSYKVKLTK